MFMLKLSRSKLELFTECPRCFWLDVKQGVKRPSGPPFTLNLAVDHLLKEEFDRYREKGKPHPVMVAYGISAVPYASEHLDRWRNNFTGVQYHDRSTDTLIFGAVDDIWIDPAKKLIVVDYKATGAREHRIYDEYKRQMEIYQWLLRQNGYDVSPTGYFVFARASKASGFGDGDSGREGSVRGKSAALPFDLFIESVLGDDSWVQETVLDAHEMCGSETPPPASRECEYCAYRDKAGAYER
jgi:CRISPR/Cas system-associated exonuclease Cas4 (RecB family)